MAGYGGMVSSPHHLATAAGISILARGGNAVDAAIAINAVQGVVAPETCGIGGDIFCLLTLPDHPEAPLALNGSGRAGSAATRLAAELRSSLTREIPQRHPAAVTVPGCVDGWTLLHEAHGRLDFASVLSPAIQLATEGFPANGEMAAGFARRHDELAGEASATDMFPGGRAPISGERITRKALAGTLEAIAANGRSAFYTGRVAEAISRGTEGALTPDEIAEDQAEWVTPLGAELFGLKGWTIPPNSQGYISLLAMGVAERLGLRGPDDPLGWHLAIESYRVAAADRDTIIADPDAMQVPPEILVTDRRMDAMAALVDPDQARPFQPPVTASGGTAYMCSVDTDGMGVSLIQSNFHGIGSGRSAPGAGFILQDRGRGFSLVEGHSNELAPGKRPLHTLAPTIWTDPAGLRAIIGTRGGHIQPQIVSQLATGILGCGLDPDVAMAVPRWSCDMPGEDATHRIVLEPGISETIVEGLASKGHQIDILEYPHAGWGPMSAITVTDGLRRGAADPRLDTAQAAAL